MILSWLLLASRELSISFLLAFPPPAAAGDFLRQEVLPEEVPWVPQKTIRGPSEHQQSPVSGPAANPKLSGAEEGLKYKCIETRWKQLIQPGLIAVPSAIAFHAW